jgi:N-terminal domain of anti-restriction factor ArdC
MNTYEIVTERIINLLERGVIPWRRPWAATGLPRNLVSKKTYRGVNSAGGHQIRLALLAHAEAGEPTGRIGAQG